MHKVFLFDLDMTLLDFHASERKALGIVLTKNGLAYSDAVYEAFMAYNKSLWLKLEKGEVGRQDLFRMRFEYIIRECGGDPADFDVLEINSDFIKTMSMNGVLMDGALEFMAKLKDGIIGSRSYIISNGATINAIGRIRSTGLDRYLDGVFISEDMGVNKPAPEFFDIVFRKTGEPKEASVVIGDSLSSDMLGARNYGLKSVWFTPDGSGESLSDEERMKVMREYRIGNYASTFDALYRILNDGEL